jgi:hypothetical protein
MKSIIFTLCLLGCACNKNIVNPTPKPDSDVCAAMCQHIGPKTQGGLGCEEGNPVYDSDKPGPKDVPNESCQEFCKLTQDSGISMNPRCVVMVKDCDQIETYRIKNPASCKL